MRFIRGISVNLNENTAIELKNHTFSIINLCQESMSNPELTIETNVNSGKNLISLFK